MRACAWFAYIISLWIFLHSFLKLSLFVWKNKRHRNKWKMFLTVLFSHSSKVFVKTIFSRDLCSLWPMVNLLKFCQCLINLRLNSGASPHYRPILFPITSFSKSIIFKGVSYQSKVCTFVKFKIKIFVWRLIWSYTHWINVWSEKHVLFTKFTLRCWKLIWSIFISFIYFTQKNLIFFLIITNFLFFFIVYLMRKIWLCTHLSVHKYILFMNATLKHIISKIIMIFINFIRIARI